MNFLIIDGAPVKSQFLQIFLRNPSSFLHLRTKKNRFCMNVIDKLKYYKSPEKYMIHLFFLILRKVFYKYILFIFIISSFMNCFSLLKPPPITFTQSQTVAEKQMIGENRELEPDGWLISSIKTSAVGQINWKKEFSDEFPSPQVEEEYKILFKIIVHTTPEIKLLKQLKYLGEGLDGSLTILDNKKDVKFDKLYKSSEDKKRIIELVKLVNDTRVKLNKIRNSLKSKTEKNENYISLVETGEYYEEKKGSWVLKQ